MFCANCGAELPDGARFCTKCGTATHSLEKEAPSSPKAEKSPTTPPRHGRAKLIAVIVCAIVVACGVCALILIRFGRLTRPGNPPDSSPQSTQSASSPQIVSVSINETTFPDKQLRTTLSAFDTNSDGTLSPDELTSVLSLDVSSTGITSLEGARRLPYLQSIDASGCPSLTTIDVSGLTRLSGLSCDDSCSVTGVGDTQLEEHWVQSAIASSTTPTMGDVQSVSFKFAWDTNGRITSSEKTTAPAGKTTTTTFEYDSEGKPSKDVEGSYTTTYAYDDQGLIAAEETKSTGTDDFSSSEAFARDSSGKTTSKTLSSTTGGFSVTSTTQYSYDDAGRLMGITTSSTTGGGAQTTSLSYDEQGRIAGTCIPSPDGEGYQKTNYTYDDQGRIASYTTGFVYYADSSLPSSSPTSLTYDDQGRLTRAAQDNGGETVFEYGSHGLSNATETTSSYTITHQLSYVRIFTHRGTEVEEPIAISPEPNFFTCLLMRDRFASLDEPLLGTIGGYSLVFPQKP